MIKLLLDENISQRVIARISLMYSGSAHVKDFDLAQTDDDRIWHFAKTNDYIIVSKDSDFHQKSLLWRHPPKFIYLRVGNCSTSYIIQVLLNNYSTIAAFAEHENEKIICQELLFSLEFQFTSIWMIMRHHIVMVFMEIMQVLLISKTVN